jgi:hypothetical protein
MKRKSKVIKNTLNPNWNQNFVFYSDDPEKIIFRVFDRDRVGSDDPLGVASLETSTFFEKEEASASGVIYQGNLKLSKASRGSIQIKILMRKLSPLKTERLLQQALQNLKTLSSASPKTADSNELILKVDEQTKIIDELKKKLKDEQAEVIAHLSKVSLLDQEVSTLKNQKKNLEVQLRNKSSTSLSLGGEPFAIEGTSAFEGTVFQNEHNSPFCVVCGHQCTIM